jgi:hypothetical protein
MKTRLAIPAAAAAFLILLFCIFTAELPPGMRSDGTDWAMYVMHSRNIVKGLPYTQTGYVYQPESTTEVGANSYPSGYPLILAPLYAAVGLNLKLFKLLNAAFLVLSLWPAYIYSRRTLSPLCSLLLIVALGLSTFVVTGFDAIGSDAPYQLVSLFVLLLLLWIYDKHLAETNPWLWGLLAGFAIAVSYLIRPFGLAFLLAVAAAELLRRHRITIFMVAAAAAFLPPLLLNNLLLHRDSSYANQFTLSIGQIASHAVAFVGFFSYLYVNPLSHAYRYALWGATLLLALFGFAGRVRGGVGIAELYVLVLLAVDCVYWSPNPRYLFPMMPIFMVYIFEGFQTLVQRFPPRFVLPIKAAATALLLIVPAANAFLVRPDPRDTLITAPRYEALCAAVRSRTAPDALALFWNPRVFALSTGRFASGWPAEGPPQKMIDYLKRVHPNYIVVDRNRPEDRKFLLPAIASAPTRMVIIYQNEQFSLVHVLDGIDAGSPK